MTFVYIYPLVTSLKASLLCMASPRQRIWFPESGHPGAAHPLPVDVVPGSYQPAMAGSIQYPPLDESTESSEVNS